MQLNSMESVQTISKCLAFLSDVTLSLNEVGDLSINKYAETALIEMFNVSYDAKFINANTIEKNNPSIDLISEKNKIGIQITSNVSLKKIKDCIYKFFKYGYPEKINKLLIFSLTQKQKSYAQQNIDNYIKHCKSKFNSETSFSFNAEMQVIDKASFLLNLDLTDTERLNKIASALKKQFAVIQQKDDLGNYYENIKDRFYDVVMNDNMGMTLKDIYIEPSFKVHVENIKDTSSFFSSHDDFLLIRNKQSIHSYFNDYFLKNNLTPEINSANFVLILGYPGQGKTSFCKKLAYDYLKNKKPEDRDLFYFKLKDIPNSKNLIHSPMSVLLDELRVITRIEVTHEVFRNSILILDGLDELFMKDGLKLDDIEILIKELIREVQGESKNKLQIIVTSRKGYVDLEKLFYDDLLIFQLNSLDKPKQLNWIEKFASFHPEAWLTIDKLEQYYKDKNYLLELLEQPLLLHMVASLKNEVSGDINKAQIYDQLFTELIQRKYSPDGQIQILKGVQAKDLRKLIREIAFNIYKTGNGFITRRDLITNKGVQSFLKKLPITDFKESLKGIMVAFYFQERTTTINGVLDEEKEYVIEFLHKSLEEYMVAEKVFQEIQISFLSKSTDDEYSLNDSFSALQKLNELFERIVTREISDYIAQMITDLDQIKKEELLERLLYFFDDFVKNDFISVYDSRLQSDPMLLIFSTFNSVWLILKTLNDEKNLLNNKTKQKIIYYTSHFTNIYPSLSYSNFNYQDLSNTEMLGANYLEGFNHTILDNSEITLSSFINVDFINVSICNSSLMNISWYDLEIINSNFTNSSLTSQVFYNVVFVNVDFSYSIISDWQFIGTVNFKKMSKRHFYGMTIWLNDLIILLKHKAPIDLQKIIVRDIFAGETIEYSYDDLIEELRKNHITVY